MGKKIYGDNKNNFFLIRKYYLINTIWFIFGIL